MLLQAGAEIKPAMFTLERSDYWHCPCTWIPWYELTNPYIGHHLQRAPNSSKQQNTLH